ncbi:MAG: GNAT family N-acetyltransferase [Candidatus Eremiobacteraeota bacterium]|nr:GNAT family N-acetyltransferase [Candidatus Eremiobacteraeota bacterium]
MSARGVEKQIEIREIQQGDFPEFRSIMRDFYRHAGNRIPENVEMELLFTRATHRQSNLVFIAAFDKGELIGILSLTFGESSYEVAPFAWCDDVYVNENHRNKGIGRMLLQRAQEIAKKRKCSSILLGVGQDEIGAQKFYQSLGFIDLNSKLMSLPVERAEGEGNIHVRALNPDERTWVSQFITHHWGDEQVIARGIIYYPHQLPGLVALYDQQRVGLLTYHIEGGSCEIVTLNSTKSSMGMGTALIEAVKASARQEGCKRLWLVTSNDNLNALRFYQKRGFELVAVHRNGITHMRTLKPMIPLRGADQIPLRDEIELEMLL